jgi:putative DNA methylase
MRFIEIDFPIEQISGFCRKEKSIRHGHLSTLQTWWARRPLAVCRAMIFLSSIPIPEILAQDKKIVSSLFKKFPESKDLKEAVINLTIELSKFENSGNFELIDLAKMIITRSNPQASLLDSFSGGGSIPLESLRLGLKTIASDLNPVATTGLLLSLQLSENISDEAMQRLKDDITHIQNKLSKYSEKNPNEEILAYFWTKTFICPHCKECSPLFQSKWLSKNKPKRAFKYSIDPKTHELYFSIFEPITQNDIKDANSGSIIGKNAKCVFCNKSSPTSEIRKQGINGLLSEKIYAKYINTSNGKEYVAINQNNREDMPSKILKPAEKWIGKNFELELDKNGIRHLWAIQYGIERVRDLFNNYQYQQLICTAYELFKYRKEIKLTSKSDKEYKFRLISLIMILNKMAVYNNKHSWWQSNGAFPASIFVRQGIAMVWNYVEIPQSSNGAGGWISASNWVIRVLEHTRKLKKGAEVSLKDAENLNLEEKSIDLVAIDPPYFDAITYAYLSDFFYPWMKAILNEDFPDWFSNQSTPKLEELIVDRKHALAPTPKTKSFYEKKMTKCLVEAKRVLRDDGIFIIMFGHKHIDAWATLFKSIKKAELHVVKSWPVHTERKSKFQHSRVDALETSCILILRKKFEKVENKSISDKEFIKMVSDKISLQKKSYRHLELNETDLFMSVFPLILENFMSLNILKENNMSLKLSELMPLLEQNI